MVNFAGEEDASDARFNVPTPEAESLTPEEFRAARWARPDTAHGHKRVVPHVTPGLDFTRDDGVTLTNIGRSFELDAQLLVDLPTLDLRIILAHLDSAAKQVTRELEDRK